jgi:hypothetical protein
MTDLPSTLNPDEAAVIADVFGQAERFMARLQAVTSRFTGGKFAIKAKGSYQEHVRARLAFAQTILAGFRANEWLPTSIRKIHYEFVSRGFKSQWETWVNDTAHYQMISKLMTKARKLGDISWDDFEDRGRTVYINPHFASVAGAIASVASWYRLDRWAAQPRRVEVWVEKDAVVGILRATCEELDVPLQVCKGTVGGSTWADAAKRMNEYRQPTTVLYLTDHDPSGIISMPAVLTRRLTQFGVNFQMERIGLTIDQVREHKPFPNPVKEKDPNTPKYVAQFGETCWELDALPGDVLIEIVKQAVLAHRVAAKWNKVLRREKQDVQRLKQLATEESA